MSGDITKFDADGPTTSRATVRFKNWGDEHGLMIRKEKLEQDAKNFRAIAKLLGASSDQEHQTYSQMLMTMADQFTNASCGFSAQAEAKPYDKTPDETAQQYVKPPETAEPEPVKA
jgi:hypothetical protein